MRPDWIGLGLLMAAGLMLFVGAVVAYTMWMLTHPPRRTYAWGVARGLPGDPGEVRAAATAETEPRALEFENWTVRSRGVNLPVWEIRGLQANGPTCVMVHGWGDSRVTMLGRIGALAAMFSRVVVFDLPGHGEAGGICRLGAREVEDLAAVMERVDGGKGGKIVVYGFSLGAGVAIEAVARGMARVDGVIAEAPYRLPQTPARNVLRSRGLPEVWSVPICFWLLGIVLGRRGWMKKVESDRNTCEQKIFDRAFWASRIVCPVLVIHSEQDEVCPIEDGREIAGKLRQGKLETVAGATHLGVWTNPATAGAAARACEKFVAGL